MVGQRLKWGLVQSALDGTVGTSTPKSSKHVKSTSYLGKQLRTQVPDIESFTLLRTGDLHSTRRNGEWCSTLENIDELTLKGRPEHVATSMATTHAPKNMYAHILWLRTRRCFLLLFQPFQFEG